jgi:hypothetical protein
LDFLHSLQLKTKLVLALFIGLASCTGGKESATITSNKVNYPSFEANTFSWKANANFPATDSLKSVQGAKENAILLLNEQLVNQLDGIRKKAVSNGNKSLDAKEIKLSLADFKIKENQVSDWKIETQKKASVYVSTVTAEIKKTEVGILLKSNKNLARLLDDASISSLLNPVVQ